MSHVADQTTLVPTNNAFSFKAEGTLLWHRIALGAISLASVYVNFFQLGQNGFEVNAAETNLKIKATSAASAGTKADPGNAKLHTLFKWVGSNCKTVPTKSWRSSNTSVGNYWLYDCASLQI